MSDSPSGPPSQDLKTLAQRAGENLFTLERELRRNRMALQVARIGTWTRSMKTGLIEWSDSLIQVFGLTESTYPRDHVEFFKLVHPDDHALFEKAIVEAIEQRTVYDVDFRYLHSSGKWRWMNGRGQAFYDTDGTVLELAGTGTDITPQKRAEQALQERELQLRQVGDNLPDGALYQARADPGGAIRFIYWSAGIERLTGVAAEEAIASPAALYALVHPDDVATLQEAEQRSLHERVVFDRVVRIRHRLTQQYRWVHLRSAPRYLRNGATVWDGIYTDITDAKEAERALQHADLRKNEFLAMLAHELRNPLSAIRNALELCQDGEGAAEIFPWARGVLDRQSAQLARLVDDLLDVSRITRGKIELRREPANLAEILDHAVESVRPLLTEKGHQLLRTYSHGAELQLHADPARLEQVFVNLLSNAAKYTEAGGRITLTAAREGELLRVSVADNGLGIPPEKIGDMFELFAQGERSIARSEGGLGLGLTIVRTLVEMHGGQVTGRSSGLHQGTEFSVTLPVGDGSTTPQLGAASPPELPARAPAKRKILVVDDNVDTAQSLARLLQRRGHQVLLAYDGRGALEMAAQERPEVVLLDLGLPELDGFAVARALRDEPATASCRIIAISGYGQTEDRTRSAAAGCDLHFVKPVEFSELEAALSAPASD